MSTVEHTIYVKRLSQTTERSDVEMNLEKDID